MIEDRIKDILSHSAIEIQNDFALTAEFFAVLNAVGIESQKKCLQCIPAKYEKLKLKQNLNHSIMKNRRFYLPEGKAYRQFGSGLILTNANLTDDLVKGIIKQNPNAAKSFIDTESEEHVIKQKAAETVRSKDPVDDMKVEELREAYKELTGEDAPADMKKAELIVNVKKERDAALQLSAGGISDDDDDDQK